MEFLNTQGVAKKIELLNAQEVARIFRCSKALIYRMASRGQIPCIRWECPGEGKRQKRETVRFKKQDIIRFVEKNYG